MKNKNITKTVPQIFKDNICTLFNFFNMAIAVALTVVGAWSNLFFIFIILVNVTIGIVHELKAKKLVEELSLLSMPTANVLRGGKAVSIPIDDVEKCDTLLLESGNQICADSTVISGELEVNESLLTGESDPVIKKEGDGLLSGSSVISGKCQAEVIHVGDDNYASKITNEVKKLKKINSELLLSLRRVTKFTGWLIIPLGFLLFIQAYWCRGNVTMQDAVVSTSAGLLGMLPKGLVLLISIGLASGIVRLSKLKVLVQDLYSLESLAHIDILCLDKTGTLTEGIMKVESVIDFKSEIPFGELMGSFLNSTDDNNGTFIALKEHFPINDIHKPVAKIPFSSARKWSAIKFEKFSFAIGAPEKLCGGELPENLRKEMELGKRVLVAGILDGELSADMNPENFRISAGIVITDPIRENATAAIDYFHRQDVEVKVISGDNPVTVSAVASKAGIRNGDKYVDMSAIGDEPIEKIAEQYTVFGRVSPQQKKQLVEAMQKNSHKVAMTGDGVNDLLAMKQSDCSIAVGQGTDAARQMAQLVLLNSDFSVLKDVVAEGRRVVNNVTKSAGVFFIKTIYSVLLCIVCIICNVPFPFIPIQITLIDLAIEGYPAFFISFEPNDRRIRGTFLGNAFQTALPNAIATFFGLASMMFLKNEFAMSETQFQIMAYFFVAALGIAAVFKSCLPFNQSNADPSKPQDTKFSWGKIRAFLSFTTLFGFYAGIYLAIKILPDKIQISEFPQSRTLCWFLFMTVVGVSIERLLSMTVFKKKKNS